MSELLPEWPDEARIADRSWPFPHEADYQHARAEAAMARLRKAMEFVQHDWECPKHVLQWDENEKRGEARHVDRCECGLDEALKAIGEIPRE
jgi:hypothetical protein